MNGDNVFEYLTKKFKMARMGVNAMVNCMENMLDDQKGEAPIKAIIGLFIIAVLAGALVPVAMTQLHDATTTNWSTGEIATYGVISIMILIAIVVIIARIATE